MTSPRFRSVNIVVDDMAGLTAFLTDLGVAIGPTAPDWLVHHRNFVDPEPDGDADLDSREFARYWGGVPDDAQVVVNLGVVERDDVDATHRRALELGATERKAPWDAFWGARYSVVQAPSGVCIGFMSAVDAARRGPPFDVSEFAGPSDSA